MGIKVLDTAAPQPTLHYLPDSFEPVDPSRIDPAHLELAKRLAQEEAPEGSASPSLSSRPALPQLGANPFGDLNPTSILLSPTKGTWLDNYTYSPRLNWVLIHYGDYIIGAGASFTLAFLSVVFLKALWSVLSSLRSLARGEKAATSTAQKASGSSYEVLGFLGAGLTVFSFSVLSAYSEDDTYEVTYLGVGAIVLGSIVLIHKGVGVVRTFFALSPSTKGEAGKAAALADLSNYALCLGRVVMCWVRYCLYDFQAEQLDMALQYTDEIGLGASTSTSPIVALLASIADLLTLVIMILINIFKFGLATFLMWLIVDLFLLRSFAHKNEDWLLRRLRG